MGEPIRPARSDELPALAEIEGRGDAMFVAEGWALPPDDESLMRLRRAARVIVVGDPPAGFAALEIVDGCAHLETVAVDPERGRRGLGRALLDAAADHARRIGSPTLTLTTFRDVPWNGPWYRRCGFEEMEEAACGPDLRAIREDERAGGLDDVGVRVAMVLRLHQDPS